MIAAGGRLSMSGLGYTVFDTAVGRCGIAWGDLGVLGVQLPEAREIQTRRRLFQLFPDARELRPSPETQSAIDGIPAFNARVYQFTRSIPRGETMTYGEVASRLRASGALHSVAQAISKNPF